jgi:transposase
MKAASGASPNITWACGCCGMVHDRDVAAARNSLRLGRQALAEGSSTLSA